MEFENELRLEADRIYNAILHSTLEWIDVRIMIDRLRDRCEEIAPESLELFDMLYVSRFVRLWEQWRMEGDTSWTWRTTGLGGWSRGAS